MVLLVVSSSEREAEDDQFVECSMAIQNVLMILLEICMILEFILLSGKNHLLFREKENRNGSGCLCSFFCSYGFFDE